MIEILPGFLDLALLIFCVIDCIQSDSARVRNLPKIGWIVLILIVPLIGGIAWLFLGRPQRGAGAAVPWRSTKTAGFPEHERPASPSRSLEEVDERLRRDQEQVDREYDEAFRRWEASLVQPRKADPPDSD